MEADSNDASSPMLSCDHCVVVFKREALGGAVQFLEPAPEFFEVNHADIAMMQKMLTEEMYILGRRLLGKHFVKGNV